MQVPRHNIAAGMVWTSCQDLFAGAYAPSAARWRLSGSCRSRPGSRPRHRPSDLPCQGPKSRRPSFKPALNVRQCPIPVRGTTMSLSAADLGATGGSWLPSYKCGLPGLSIDFQRRKAPCGSCISPSLQHRQCLPVSGAGPSLPWVASCCFGLVRPCFWPWVSSVQR
jgi:hypothetical protein